MSTVSAIFSALGNNSSIAQIAVKDSIETVGRTAMAYKEGSKTSKRFGALDAREKFTEAVATSAVWLGGIPTLKYAFDKFYTNKKYDFSQLAEYGKDALAKTDVRLLNKNSAQALSLDKIKDVNLVPHVKKILDNPSQFKNTFAAKSAVSTLIPIALVGYILPKTIYAFTHKMIEKKKKQAVMSAYQNQQDNKENLINSTPAFATFMGKAKRANLSFHGNGLDTVAKMFIQPNTNMVMVDAGIWAGRAGTSRTFHEACERTINEAGYVFFLYCGGKYVAKALEGLTKKVAGIPTALDAKLLQDKSFTDSLLKIAKDSELAKSALKFTENSEKSIIGLIDNNLAKNAGKFTDLTLQAAQKVGLIDVVKGARNPLKFIETQDVASLNNSLKEFVGTLAKSANPEALVNKAKTLKRGSIAANIAICSAVLAYGLPKLQYLFRNTFSPNSVAPGLAQYYDAETANKNNIAKA